MNRLPVIPNTERRPAAITDPQARLADLTTRRKEAGRALAEAEDDYQHRERIDADALARTDAAGKPPKSAVPAITERRDRALNHRNALARLEAQARDDLTAALAAHWRDWYAAEQAVADQAADRAREALAALLDALEVAQHTRAVADWVALNRGQDYRPPVPVRDRVARLVTDALIDRYAAAVAGKRIDKQRKADIEARRYAELLALQKRRGRGYGEPDLLAEENARQAAEREAGAERMQAKYLDNLAALGAASGQDQGPASA